MAFQGDSIYWVEVEKVVPNPFQPRREFDQAKLQELADSIRMYGVLQPLTVTRREVQRGDGTFYTEYELIAGERRLRASKLAQVPQVPVIIRTGEQSEQEKLELAIIENLQREDLNAIDRALAFKQLSDVFGLSHSQVAAKVGRSREYVSNSIRLLGLREHMLDALRRGELTEGHARTLLMLNDRPEEQEVVFQEILLKKLSVREVERIARKIATDKVRKKDLDFDAELIEIEKRFTETLGTRVQIQKTDFGGKLTIDYFSTEDLEIILGRIRSEEALYSTRVAAEDDVPPVEAMAKLAEHTPLTLVEPGVHMSATGVVSESISMAPTAPVESSQTTTEPAVVSVPVPEVPTPTPSAPASQVFPTQTYQPSQSAPVVSNQAQVAPVSPMSGALAMPPMETAPVESAAPSAASTYVSATPVIPGQYQTPTQTPATIASEVVQPTPTKPVDEDDGNLYSVTQFTV